MAVGANGGRSHFRNAAGIVDAASAFGLSMDGSTDDVAKANKGMAAAGGGTFIFQGRNGMAINSGLVIPDKTTVLWAADKVVGAGGWTKITGCYYVTDPQTGAAIDLKKEISSPADIISSTTASGTLAATSITVNSGTGISTGGDDFLLILSRRDDGGSTIPSHYLETITTSRSGTTVNLGDSLPATYSSTYTNPTYEANFGTQNRTYVYKIVGSLLTVNGNRGDYVITVADTSGYAVNDVFHLKDNKVTVSGNVCNLESIKVAEVLSSTRLRLQNPLMGNYTTAQKARILKYNPVREAWQIGMGGVTRLSAAQTSVTYHLNYYDLYEHCGDQRLSMNNSGTFKSLGNFIRARVGRFYQSMFSYFSPTNNLAAGEGYHYGIYGATFADISHGITEGARHGYLLFQSARGCKFSTCTAADCLTAAFDSHGAGESDNLFIDCTYYGRSNRDRSGNDTGFKFGNPTHREGPYYSAFINCHAIIQYPANGALANNPVATTNSSSNIVISIANNELLAGENITTFNLTAFNNLTANQLNDTFTVNSATSSSVSVTNTGTANATGSGGGSAGTWQNNKSIGFEFIPPATNCRVINCSASNVEIGFRAIQNSNATSDVTTGLIISGFKTYDCRRETILIDGSASLSVANVSLSDIEIHRGGSQLNTFSAQVMLEEIAGFVNLKGYKTFNLPTVPSGAYHIRADSCVNVQLADFDCDGGDRGIRVSTNTGYQRVGPGVMRNFVNGTILYDAGDNSALVWKFVDVTGLGVNPVMGGTKSSGRVNHFYNGAGGHRTSGGNVTVNFSDYYIGITSTSSARTITAPDASSGMWDGKEFVLKDESNAAGTNNITWSPTTSTVDYGVINTNGGAARFRISNGNYFKI